MLLDTAIQRQIIVGDQLPGGGRGRDTASSPSRMAVSPSKNDGGIERLQYELHVSWLGPSHIEVRRPSRHTNLLLPF